MLSNKTVALILILLSVFVVGCSNQDPVSSEVRQLSELEKSLVESSSKFGLTLFKKIANEDQGNIFISPLSVSMALGMTLNGAANETKTAMEHTLALNGLTTEEINQSYQSLTALLTSIDPETAFQIANSIWYREDRTFEQDFIDTNKEFFDALVRALDFNDPASVDIINNWVSDHTNGKIEEILQSINPTTVMFLINAIYFNGTWVYEFDKEQTVDGFFHLANGSQKEIPMMVQTNEFAYYENDEFQAIDLPYGNGNFSMTVFLPRPEKDLDFLIEQLNDATWKGWLARLAPDSVTLQMPKFKLEYEITLNDILADMGMGIAFLGAADFTRMYRPGGLFISFVKHKTFVEVDEEGTEAAAVTVVAIDESAGGPEPYKFMSVDRPFLFAIREASSQSILFIGKVTEPNFE